MHVDTELKQYIATALWSSNDESTPEGGEPLDANYGPEDIAPETLTAMRADVEAFIANADPDALEFWAAELGDGQVGHDFWLTRNRHGAGFWDRFYGDHTPGAMFGRILTDDAKAYGESHLYVSGGLIYNA